MNLDNHILKVMRSTALDARPVTLSDLAREFGTTPALVLPAARRLVEAGQVRPVMVDVYGVPTLRALQPVAPTPEPSAAE